MAALAAVFACLAFAGPAAAQGDVKPFGEIDCAPHEGIRFCQGGTVPTWDGVPLDTNVALPAGGSSDLPLVVLLHGWGGSKTGVDNDPGEDTRLEQWAKRGYAVLSYTARGFNGSCGNVASRTAGGAACLEGWIHLGDTRYEVRDTQYLTGLLVDEGLVDPQRIGATGGSYGGGQSMALAALNDRTMMPDGSLVPWTSPGGTPLRLAAAAPDIPWTDLVYSLVPNGRTLDYVITDADDDLVPTGVPKQSYITGLYAAGQATGYYAPPGVDPEADLTTWFARTNAGEPYDDDSVVDDFKNQIANYHSSYYIDDSRPPAPLFISEGWVDDLFPVDEALRFYNRARAHHPSAVISLMFLDTGHARGSNKRADNRRRDANQEAFFDRYVKGDPSATPPTGVEVLTTTCPREAPSDGPFHGPDWESMHPGEVRFQEPAAKTFSSEGGNPDNGRAIDPIAGGGNACTQVDADDDPGAATYRLPEATGGGYTLLGSPTVIADLEVTGPHAQIASRLWDVAPDGRQTLVARGIYRPDATGRQVFQLHPNAWKFEAGHVPKLELLGQDAPYARPSNGAFSVEVSNLDLRLPTRERMGAPGALPLPPGAQRAMPGMRLRVKYTRAKPRSARRRCRRWSRARATVRGGDQSQIRRVVFRLGKKRIKGDIKRLYRVKIRPKRVRRVGSRKLRAQVQLKGGGKVVLKRKLRRCAPR